MRHALKNLLIAAILTLLFFGIFVFRIDSTLVGPNSSDEVDDLGITNAYIDESSNCLFLVTSTRWTQLDLSNIQRQNSLFSYAILPRRNNFAHWKSFVAGQLTVDMSRFEPVAVCTKDFASFGYKNDGTAWQDHKRPAITPIGFHYALFRSNAEYAEDNHASFKSYILQTPSRGPDHRLGVQFFYHPDYRYIIGLQHPAMFIIFGPSYLALCIALPLAFSRLGMGATVGFLS